VVRVAGVLVVAEVHDELDVQAGHVVPDPAHLAEVVGLVDVVEVGVVLRVGDDDECERRRRARR
jgi:hypothetical protein